jgi:hypothetical protein
MRENNNNDDDDDDDEQEAEFLFSQDLTSDCGEIEKRKQSSKTEKSAKNKKKQKKQFLNPQSRRKKTRSGTQTHPPTVFKSQREEGTGGDANKTEPHHTPTTTTTCSQIFAATFLMQKASKQTNKQNWIILIKHLIYIHYITFVAGFVFLLGNIQKLMGPMIA